MVRLGGNESVEAGSRLAYATGSQDRTAGDGLRRCWCASGADRGVRLITDGVNTVVICCEARWRTDASRFPATDRARSLLVDRRGKRAKINRIVCADGLGGRGESGRELMHGARKERARGRASLRLADLLLQDHLPSRLRAASPMAPTRSAALGVS